MAYSDKVIDHYEQPRNVGTLDKEDETVGTGLVGAPACGDVMRLQIRVNPETNVVVAGESYRAYPGTGEAPANAVTGNARCSIVAK